MDEPPSVGTHLMTGDPVNVPPSDAQISESPACNASRLLPGSDRTESFGLTARLHRPVGGPATYDWNDCELTAGRSFVVGSDRFHVESMSIGKYWARL
jgi:hypothetical protein